MCKEHKMILIIMFLLAIPCLAVLYYEESNVLTMLDDSFVLYTLLIALIASITLGFYVSYRPVTQVTERINAMLLSANISDFKPLAIKTSSSNIIALISSINDLMARYVAEIESITDQSYRDRTTYLPNKLWLNERCEHVRFGALLLIQVESVNNIAESLKFDEYEDFMRAISSALSNTLEQSVVIARVDSDKYALGLEDERNIESIIRQILTLENVTFDICSHAIYVEFLFGISSACEGEKSKASTLLDDAKLGLYEARRSNIKQAHFDSSMRLNNSEKIRAYNKLKQAVKNDEFIPYFQPIIDLTSGAITGVEALARWNDPERGIVGPYAFIELAEDTGLIDAIGLSIFKKSLRWYQCNQHQLPSTFCIHVNISIRQLMSSNFVEEVKQLMNDVGYSHRNLCFEFTESIYMESKQVIDNLVGLRELGISFAIDDFGTGYSSFSYLRDLDFSSLKIDKSFVSDDNVEILKAMIKVGRSLGCEVIAEGVETAEQCALLRKLKCPMVQGYLFSKPLPEEEFTEFMLHNNEQSMLSLC